MLSIIIPVRNEAENIIPLISKIEKILVDKEYELIFIDDFSIDNTVPLLRKLSQENTKIRIIKKTNEKMGVGISIRIGIFQSKGEKLLTMDADLSHNPSDIPKLLNELNEDTDLVIGSRYLKKSKYYIQGSRKILSKLFNFFLKSLFFVTISDITSGFKAIKKEKLKHFRLQSEHFEIHPEFNLKASFLNLKIKEVPIIFIQRQRGKSKLNYYHMFINYLRLIFTLLFNRR